MTRSELFTAAHKLAKTLVATLKSYKAAFSAALKKVYSQLNNKVMTLSEKFEAMKAEGMKCKFWNEKRIYVDVPYTYYVNGVRRCDKTINVFIDENGLNQNNISNSLIGDVKSYLAKYI